MRRSGGGPNRKQVPLTIDDLRVTLSYDPGTGAFTNTRSAAGSRRVGPVGTKNKFNGYVSIMRGNKNYPAHRLAWAFVYGYWPECIDHINGVRDDNRIANLRECTRAQNNMNRPQRRDSSQPFKGVSRHSCGSWRARIQRRHLGLFSTADAALAAYEAAASVTFGSFQRT